MLHAEAVIAVTDQTPMKRRRRAATVRRPVVHSEAIEAEILQRLLDGETLASICEDDHLPTHSAVRQWAYKDRPQGFAARYAHAREIGYSRMGDDILRIADDPSIPPDRARLMVDTRKWMLSKMLPKVYGDRVTMDHHIERIEKVEVRFIGSGDEIEGTARDVTDGTEAEDS